MQDVFLVNGRDEGGGQPVADVVTDAVRTALHGVHLHAAHCHTGGGILR